jgi:hypothetical protein
MELEDANLQKPKVPQWGSSRSLGMADMRVKTIRTDHHKMALKRNMAT